MTPHQRYYPPDYILFFTASIILPTGYTLDMLDAYRLHISIDQNELMLSSLSELKPSLIILEEEQVEVCCMSPFIVHQLDGPLHYNVVATGFKADENYNVDTSITAFSLSDTIILSHPIAYSCPVYETQKPLSINEFTFAITQGEEYLINANGETLYRGNLTTPNPDFVACLKECVAARTLEVSYTLTFHKANPLT